MSVHTYLIFISTFLCNYFISKFMTFFGLCQKGHGPSVGRVIVMMIENEIH